MGSNYDNHTHNGNSTPATPSAHQSPGVWDTQLHINVATAHNMSWPHRNIPCVHLNTRIQPHRHHSPAHQSPAMTTPTTLACTHSFQRTSPVVIAGATANGLQGPSVEYAGLAYLRGVCHTCRARRAGIHHRGVHWNKHTTQRHRCLADMYTEDQTNPAANAGLHAQCVVV